MKKISVENAVPASYRSPEITTVGDIVTLTTSGGAKVVDAWAKDGHTAVNWNILDSPGRAIIDTDVLD